MVLELHIVLLINNQQIKFSVLSSEVPQYLSYFFRAFQPWKCTAILGGESTDNFSPT